MKTSTSIPQFLKPLDTLLSSAIFVLLLVGPFALLSMAPYMGFYFNPSSGEVIDLYVDSANGLQLGDVIKKVGQATWDEYRHDKYLVIFEDADVYEMTIERAGRKIDLQWRLPGFNAAEFMGRFFSTWWLSFFFWFFGFITHRFIQPRDLAWKLLVAFNYLMAVFIAFGNVSAFHILGSLVWMRAAVWLMTPVTLQLHWIFPTPLRKLPSWVWNGLYLLFSTLGVLEVLPIPSLLPYSLGLLLTFSGGLVLLVIHYIQQPSGRSDIRLLGLTLLSIISFSLVGVWGEVNANSQLPLFALIFLPGAYFYSINRRRMGNLELRASRAISSVAYLFLLMSILSFVINIFTYLALSLDLLSEVILSFSLVTAVLTLYIFPRFQTQVEQHFLGITLSHQRILETYATRIPSSATLADLAALLEKDIFNSLQVQQYAFLVKEDANYVTALSKNVTTGQIQVHAALDLLTTDRDYRLIPPSADSTPLGWIRMILSLKVESDIVGLWLLGRRDPDDLYPQADLPIIQSLASQTAIALSNIRKVETAIAQKVNGVQNDKSYRLDKDTEEDRVLAGLTTKINIQHQTRKLKVFLCHSKDDKAIVRKIYQKLRDHPAIDPWFDEEELLPGKRWQSEIEEAVQISDVVLVCLSQFSLSKEGFVQYEISRALDVALQKPENVIYIIPVRLEDCLVPSKLSQFQWLDYFANGSHEKLLQSLKKRAQTLNINFE